MKLSIQLAPEQLAALDHFANKRHLSRAAALRLIFEQGITAQGRLDRLAEAVG